QRTGPRRWGSDLAAPRNRSAGRGAEQVLRLERLSPSEQRAVLLERLLRCRLRQIARRAFAAGEQDRRRLSDHVIGSEDGVNGARGAGDAWSGGVVPRDRAHVLRSGQSAAQYLACIHEGSSLLACHVGAHRTKAGELPRFVQLSCSESGHLNSPGNRPMGGEIAFPYPLTTAMSAAGGEA